MKVYAIGIVGNDGTRFFKDAGLEGERAFVGTTEVPETFFTLFEANKALSEIDQFMPENYVNGEFKIFAVTIEPVED